MINDYSHLNLIEIDQLINSKCKRIILTGKNLTLNEINAIGCQPVKIEFTKDKQIISRVKTCFEKMMIDVCNGVPIYGCNTSYGARASRILTHGSSKKRINTAKEISNSIIHVDVSVGPLFEQEIIRSAILIRINMLMNGVSGVHINNLAVLRELLNKQITPLVNKYGGIGASGDLAHNCRIIDAARQLDGVKVINKQGKIIDAKNINKIYGIKPLILNPKAGLGLINGDNFSTAMAFHLAYDTLQALLIAIITGSMMVEVLRGTNRGFHPLLAAVRPHQGQKEIADIFRFLLDGSDLAYQEMLGHKRRRTGVKAQDGYSIRGISQYLGVDCENLKRIFDIIELNANSVSDNPLWVAPEYANPGEQPWQWVSGANFLATHMVDVMDNSRKILTHIVKLNDRHLARLVNPHENNGLPANLSDKKCISHCAFKGVQIQSGMFEVYSMLLSIPVSTFFGVHEEGNQDITSHALTSGIIGQDNLRIARYSLAQNLMAVCQAVDLRGGSKKLSKQSQPVYQLIRANSKYVTKERPLFNDIEAVYQLIVNGKFNQMLRDEIFTGFLQNHE